MRRLIALALVLATVLQGPTLAFAATLGASMGDSLTHACGGQTLADESDCEACCSHGAMPSCAAHCPVPVIAAVLPTLPTSQRIAVHSVVIQDTGMAPFADHDPPNPLRPPIV